MILLPRRARSSTLVLVAIGVLLAASSVVSAAGAAPAAPRAAAGVRYLDPVFSQVTVNRDLQYGSAVNDRGQTEALKLDLYRPAGDTATDRPAVVVAHGGAFVTGNKGWAGVWADDLARRGYVTVSIDYRLATVDISSDPRAYVAAVFNAKHDAQAAVRWLRKNAATYGIDPDRIGMTGGSAGAAMSLLVAAHPEDVGDSGNPGFSSAVRAVVSNSGTLGTAFATDDDPPALLVNGTADPTVPFANAKAYCDGAVAVHVWCTMVAFPGTGHTVGAYEPELLKSLTATYFFDHLAVGVGTSAGPFPDAVTFVSRLYRDLLLREGDPSGVDHWSSSVAHGSRTPPQLVDQFAQSGELQRSFGTVTRSFLGYLGRPPDPSGMAYWVGKLRAGRSVAWVNASLAASPEFERRQAGLSEAGFVTDLYEDLLARTPDAGGLAYWTGKLAAGTSRASVVGSFVAQPETIRATAPQVAATIGYVGLLGRTPTASERDAAVAAMRAGGPATDLYGAILGSAEYEARITP